MERTHYFADIIQDTRATPAVWHCIIQQQGSNKVIAWFQEQSEQEAQQSAAAELENLCREDLLRAGQLPLVLSPGA